MIAKLEHQHCDQNQRGLLALQRESGESMGSYAAPTQVLRKRLLESEQEFQMGRVLLRGPLVGPGGLDA